jgi:hypothetical protein
LQTGIEGKNLGQRGSLFVRIFVVLGFLGVIFRPSPWAIAESVGITRFHFF